MIVISAYRASGYDTCMGCYMGSSDSDYEIVSFEDTISAAEFLRDKDLENLETKNEREICDWECSLILNGKIYTRFYDNSLHPKDVRYIFDTAKDLYNLELARQAEVAKAKKKEDARLKEEAKKQRAIDKEIADRKKLKELQEQYGKIICD